MTAPIPVISGDWFVEYPCKDGKEIRATIVTLSEFDGTFVSRYLILSHVPDFSTLCHRQYLQQWPVADTQLALRSTTKERERRIGVGSIDRKALHNVTSHQSFRLRELFYLISPNKNPLSQFQDSNSRNVRSETLLILRPATGLPISFYNSGTTTSAWCQTVNLCPSSHPNSSVSCHP